MADVASASQPMPPADAEPVADRSADVVTTDDEAEGFRIVRAIVCSEVPATRVVARDAKSYFGILLDDTNRKPIARLWFNRTQRYLSVFDESKAETKLPIAEITDIYNHADALRKTVAGYLAKAGDRAEC